MAPDDRRPFRGAQFDRARSDRPGPPGADRPPFGQPRPFNRPPTRGGDMATPEHRVRIRDGEREVEVSGNPAFVRQLLDDLPALLERLRGAPAGRTAISMPPPPRNGATGAEPIPPQPTPVAVVETTAAAPAGGRRRTAQASLEDRVLAVLAQSTEPLAVAAIRERLGDDRVSGQQVRRLLERAGPRVAVSGDRPATYSLP